MNEKICNGFFALHFQRSQQGILKAFQLPENVNKKKVDDEMRAKLKGKNYYKLIG